MRRARSKNDSPVVSSSFNIRAEGVSATGKNHYYVDSDTNTIHVNANQPATATDPPIGQ